MASIKTKTSWVNTQLVSDVCPTGKVPTGLSSPAAGLFQMGLSVHKITEQFGLERTFTGNLVQPLFRVSPVSEDEEIPL